MDWYNIHISNDENISGKQQEIQNAYDSIVMVATAPKEFALFSRYNSDDGTIDVFITPELSTFSELLLKKYNAVKCKKPSPDGIKLLMGAGDALEHFN